MFWLSLPGSQDSVHQLLEPAAFSVKRGDEQNLRQLWVSERGSLPGKYSSSCAQKIIVPFSINYEKNRITSVPLPFLLCNPAIIPVFTSTTWAIQNNSRQLWFWNTFFPLTAAYASWASLPSMLIHAIFIYFITQWRLFTCVCHVRKFYHR